MGDYNSKPILEKTKNPYTMYGEIFEKHPLPILLIDCKNFSIREVNKAACNFYGYDKKSFSNLTLADIDPSLKGKTNSKILNIYRQYHLDSLHKLRIGAEIQVEIYNRLFKYRNHLFLYLVILNLDGKNDERQPFELMTNEMTLFKSEKHESVNKKAKQLDEFKSRFISTSSHEFRTPLTTILTSSELLLMVGRSLNEEKYLEHIIKIQNAVMYITSLLDDMLAINNAESGKWKFNPSRINLYNFCVKLIDAASNDATPQHSINFNFNLNDHYAIVDDKLLQLILSNLLSNAIKYSPKGGEVTLTVNRVGFKIEFIVKDNGIGIPQQDQKKLFEIFFRSQNTGNIKGTGLGLSIVKRSVESHGGEVKFKSKLNEGSTFYVSIPLVAVV